ncbi:MAG: non-canonical purine NTP diphosphatase [Bacteroidia bacterium]|nr:non-canonical purine NTP diphosphatase [Bacteroidia bacterium]MBT8277595.1 non-canonical purine NTP diphosphatase [Bacteroidia bacterium]NND26217.1 non-canonical purine NTP diphosphatase [Flavobacteriaceae bacterium]NNK59345.1 non-canonical purine NTP diphosphatase [Flavobacteriaceae bacterium]NNL33368.1 non-canonical purine NTP diphosphatase [Flavobacteriaceae bacterium]
MKELVFATNNLNKLKEVQSLLPDDIKLLSLADIGCKEDIPETQLTIEGNAIMKATFIKERYGYDCFADDTGLEVQALNNEPGVFSARYAGPQRNANDNMDKLLNELEYKKNRSARFKTVIALIQDDQLKTFTGICEGEISKTKKGDQGFGYDPIFRPQGHIQTFGQLDLKKKNKISHRAKAILQLCNYLTDIE